MTIYSREFFSKEIGDDSREKRRSVFLFTEKKLSDLLTNHNLYSPKFIDSVLLTLSSALAILAGSAGYNIFYILIVFVAATAITLVAGVAVFWSTRHPDAEDKHSLAKFEKHWVIIIIIIFVIFSVTTTPYIPYPYAHANVKPSMYVDVQARQFSWCLSMAPNWGPPNCVTEFNFTVGNTVLFYVQSIDVTHGFGVYQYIPNGSNAYGSILFQVQVMPNYTNSIEYQFTMPGIYYVRCLEFCGYGHFAMISQFNVTQA